MGDKNRIGSLIKKRREDIKMSKAELSRRVGLDSNSHIGSIEKGWWTPKRRATPTPELLEKIIKALGVSADLAAEMREANWEARANAAGQKLAELAERRAQEGTQGEPRTSEEELSEGVIRLVRIPLIDETFTGNPEEVVMGTKGLGVVGRASLSAAMLAEHEGCLALLIQDDAMAPKAGYGAIVAFSMNQKAVQGKPAVVGLKDRTVCRIWRESKGTVTLEPFNPDCAPIVLPKSEIRWHHVAIGSWGPW